MADGTEGARHPGRTARTVTHAEAREACRRLVNSHFRNGDEARCSIPANPDADDDLVLTAYVEQRAAADVDGAAEAPVRLPAPELDPRWSGARLGLVGMSVELALPGGAATVAMYLSEVEHHVERGRDIAVLHVPADEVLDLRRCLNTCLPSDPIGPRLRRARGMIGAAIHAHRKDAPDLPPWRDVDPGSPAGLYALALADEVLAVLGLREDDLPATEAAA